MIRSPLVQWLIPCLRLGSLGCGAMTVMVATGRGMFRFSGVRERVGAGFVSAIEAVVRGVSVATATGMLGAALATAEGTGAFSAGAVGAADARVGTAGGAILAALGASVSRTR